MKKLLNALPLLMLLTSCDLYYGNGGGNGSWNYCGSDGYYQCDNNNNCTLVSATCPPDSPNGDSGGSGGGTTGYECGSNSDCAAGCYCTTGNVCEEGGFCTSNSDCGSGYYCDTSRSSCEPNQPTNPACGSDSDCVGAEQVCDPTTNTCQTASCAGTVTCNIVAPTCPSGSAPLIYDGCYTGTCQAIASCDAPPACPNINDETDCLSRANDCSAVYTGLDCTDSSGAACTSGDAGCTCASFQFDHCAAQ